MTNNHIEKIQFLNFKGFRNQRIDGLNSGLNILIGDNDTGKSSVLLAIDLVLSCNPGRVESIGLDKLLNLDSVNEFLSNPKRQFKDLPIMEVDLYLTDQGRHEFEGEHNVARENAYGICLICRPNDGLADLIEEVISLESPAFPYEYYTVEIRGFGGEPLSAYKKPVQHLQIDNTKISNDYASKSHVRALYRANTDEKERNQLKYGYRQIKGEFSKSNFKELNEKNEDGYEFALKSGTKANLETDITISKAGLDIESLGVGAQCFIRTSFALSKKTNIDVVLLEEPENHLSHVNMRKLIEKIKEASKSQLFIATHNSLICSRLDLRHAILLPSFGEDPIKLNNLPDDTADFFMKAPNSGVLEFVLSSRNILVEGDSEYILMPSFYKHATKSDLNKDEINVISIGGVSFPRYLDIAQLLGTLTAVITDNDGNADGVKEKYAEYVKSSNIEVFYDDDDQNRTTFEKCLYPDNQEICDELFSEGRKTLSVQDYMLKNKSTVAYELATKKSEELSAPKYIAEAIKWIGK